jgi:hypothetical protein
LLRAKGGLFADGKRQREGVVVVAVVAAANHTELVACLAAGDKNARGTATTKKANHSPLDFWMTHTELWAVVRTDSILAKALFTSEHFW